MMRRPGWRRVGRQAPLYACLGLAVLFTTFPLYWMVSISFKTPRGIYRQPSLLIDVQTLGNYTNLLVERGFLTPLRNSVVVAATTTVVATLIAVIAAYSLVRLRYRARDWIGRAILLAYLLPGSLLFIPLYVILVNLGLGDTHAGLVMTYLTFAVPFGTWLMMGYFKAIPADLEEQAMVDGCSRLGALGRILLPIAAPGAVTAAIFTFTLAWDDLLFALVYLTSQEKRTAPVALAQLVVNDVFLWGELMAGATLAAIPVLVLYIVAQRFVVQGIAAGAVKG
jgi:multiple sugar transport system permease protein